MFAKPRMAITSRVVIIAVVLFSLLTPAESAGASSGQKVEHANKPSDVVHPVYRFGRLGSSVNPTFSSQSDTVSYQVANCQADANGNLTIAAGTTCSLEAGSYTFNSISVSGTLIINGNPTLNQGVTINAEELTVEADGKINADGNGYPIATSPVDGSGPGGGKRSTGWGGGGGGHGGHGQNSSGNGGGTYGSVTNPTHLGSSGGPGINGFGSLFAGGAGGGAIHLNVSGTSTINGSVSADGNAGVYGGVFYPSGGGGAGGSIWIETSVLAGTGLIYANGGVAADGGGGGGGRIAIYYESSTFQLDSQHVYARGGEYGNSNTSGGAGTIYLKDISLGGLDKLLVNNGLENTPTTYAGLPTATYAFDKIVLTGKGILRILGTNSSLTFNNQTIIGDGTGRIEVEGIVHAPQNLTLSNTTLAILGDIAEETQTVNLTGTGKLELYASSTLNNGIFAFSDITVGNGATLKLVSYDNKDLDYTNDRGISLEVNNLTVDLDGNIDGSGTGYAGTTGDGTGPGKGYLAGEGGGGGGGYGGAGQTSSGSGGVIYGSINNPADLGSSGGAGRNYYDKRLPGGAGGGAIHLTVNETLTLNGQITVDGMDGTWEAGYPSGGGGAGGSIWIEANSLIGTGTIHANGGRSPAGGKGAGGRIAVYAENANHTLTISAEGGHGYEVAGKGTVYLGFVDPLRSAVTVTPEELTADGTSSATLTVTLRNADDLPLPNKVVKASIVSGNSLEINGSTIDVNQYFPIGTTDANGVVSATVTTNKAGERTISAQVGQESIVEQAIVNFVPDNISGTVSRLQVNPSQVPANGSTPSQVTVTVLDGNNNPIPNATVILQATGGHAVITQPANLTDDQGKTTGQVVNSTAETVTISATAIKGTENKNLTDTDDVTFKGADLSAAITAPPEAPAGVEAQYPYIITVSNSNYLPVQNINIDVTLPSGITYLRDTSGLPKTQDGQTVSWTQDNLGPDGKITFTLYGKTSSSLAIGTLLSTQASVETTSSEESVANNEATVDTLLVSGYSVEASINPSSQSLGIGATANYEITIRNSGLLADGFNVSVTGLNEEQYTLSQTSLALSPQEEGKAVLSIQVESCTASTYPFNVSITSQSTGEVIGRSGTAEFLSAPSLSDLRPVDGAIISSRDVTISWHTDAPTTGLLTVYPVGEPQFSQTYPTPEGTSHSVVVPTKTPAGWKGKNAFAWQVTATSDCQTSRTSGVNQFTIQDGVIFQNHALSYQIDRDYNQTAQVVVINKGNQPREVQVEIEHSYEDLVVNFRGSGSIDEKITLLPGESRTVELAIYAQDAELIDQDYILDAVLTSEEGVEAIRDLATIKVRVLFEANYTITKLSTDALNISTFRVTNLGQPISDLYINAVDQLTRLPAPVHITPQISHARLGTGEFIDFKVIPLYYTEGLGNLAGSSMPLKVVAAPAKQNSLSLIDIVSKVNNTFQYHPEDLSCSGGKNLYPVTFKDVVMDIPINVYYCLNTERLTIDISLPPFVNANNITGVVLNLNMIPPGEETGSYDLDINVNGHAVMSVDDARLQGTFSFPIDKTYIKSGSIQGVTNKIEFVSDLANPSHDVIGRKANLYIALDEVTVHVCASSAEEAELLAGDLYEFEDLPENFGVSISKPNTTGTVQPEEDGSINLRAYVTDNGDSYVNFYQVEAEINYLDVPLSFPEKVQLFDDGLSAHGDPDQNDRSFNALWVPKHGGNIEMTVTATLPDGRSDTDSTTFNIEALPDLAVTKVYIEDVAFLNNQARVRAEITNLGFTVSGPINVDFIYYATDENGNKVGNPVHTSHLQILTGQPGQPVILTRGSSVEIEDTEFTPASLSLYFVEVVVDPSP